MLFSLPHHPKSWTRESKKGRNRSKRTCMGLSCLSRTLIREVSQKNRWLQFKVKPSNRYKVSPTYRLVLIVLNLQSLGIYLTGFEITHFKTDK